MRASNDALPAAGVAVVNADDEHAAFFRRRAGARRVVDFGIGAAMVGGGYLLKELSSELRLRTPAGEASATLAIPGLHNVRNAFAAAACAHAAGIELAINRRGAERLPPLYGAAPGEAGAGRTYRNRRQL